MIMTEKRFERIYADVDVEGLKKRFVYYEHKGADYILDTPNKSLDFIEMLGDCLEAEEIVDLLNQLSDENEELKKENAFLKKRCDEYWKELGLNNDYLNEE